MGTTCELWYGLKGGVLLGLGLGKAFNFLLAIGGVKNRPALLSARIHFPVASHLNSSRYHLVLLKKTFPSVFWSASEKRSNPDWDGSIVYFAWDVGEGAI